MDFDAVGIKLVKKNLSSSIYLSGSSDLPLNEKLKLVNLYITPSVEADRFSIGLMTKAIAQNIFESLEELLLTNLESQFFQKICPFKEIDPAEIQCRTAIKELLTDTKNPKRYAEAVKIAVAYHAKVLKKSKETGSVSCEISTNNHFLDDSSLAYDLAFNLSSISPPDAIDACEIYSSGAFFKQQAQQLMMSVAIGYTSDFSTKELEPKMRQIRSKAMHAAIQSWVGGFSETNGLVMLLKLIEFQAGCDWNQPKDRLFHNNATKLLLESFIDLNNFDSIIATLTSTLTNSVFQYYDLQTKEKSFKKDTSFSLPSLEHSETSADSKGETKSSVELKSIADVKTSANKVSNRPQNIHHIVDWLTAGIDAPFPKVTYDPAEKAKLKIPETLQLISGNLANLLANKNSREIVIFARNPVSSSDAKTIAESSASGSAAETKDAKEKTEQTLTHIQISRVQNAKLGKNKVDHAPLTLHLFFNSTLFQPPYENPQPVQWAHDYSEKLKEAELGSSLFHNYITAFEPGKGFTGGKYFGLTLELMNPNFIEYILQVIYKQGGTLTLLESQYLQSLFAFPMLLADKLILKEIKKTLLNKKWDDAIALTRQFHNNVKEAAKSHGLIIEDDSRVLDDSKVAFFLGEALQYKSPDNAIAALELVSDGSPWVDLAQQKIIDIALKTETEDPKQNRNLRSKGIWALVANALKMEENPSDEDYVQAQKKLNSLYHLLSIHSGVSQSIFKPFSPKIVKEVGLSALGDYLMSLIEPLVDKLYEYRMQYGPEPLLAAFQAPMIFAYSKHKDDTLGAGSAGAAAGPDLGSVRSLDDEEEEAEAGSGLSLTPFTKGGK